MTVKQKINSVLSAILPNSAVFAEYYKRGGGKKADWKRQPEMLRAKEIKDWKNGVAAATDPENPRRGELMRFYQSLLLDNHLAGVIDTRILRVQRSPFMPIDGAGNENEDLKQMLQRPWLEDMIRLVLMSRFQGATLIEMTDLDAETLELTGVNEAPQSNFIAQKGIVIREEYDDSGVDFRSGAYSTFYLPAGGDWDIGMLNQLAMIVLAKKLELGSWMSYIDKYGIPPIFAITERRDAGRRDELFEMLSSLRQNMFAVLEGNERIEAPRISETNSHRVFLSLIDSVCNKEISKRVLGGAATTDEKGFVGAAQVQERVARDRYEADKLLFKYIFNAHIRKRLVKISPVYAGLEKVSFEWNNQETPDIKGYIDAIEKLSGAFEFDTDEIKARTGLPITGVRQLPSPLPEPDGKDDKNLKKKPDATLKRGALPPYGVFAATWDAAVERLTEQIWNGQAKPAGLDRDLALKYYSTLNRAAQGGWGAGYFDDNLTRRFRENLLKFSGAKSYALIDKIAGLKVACPTREAFAGEARKLIDLHNETYQRVEDKFAANSASAARDFNRYVKDIDIYPCLKNRTMSDGSVRPEHAANEGIIKPVNEWRQIPPYDPGCRCWLEQTTEKPDGRKLTNLDDRWANNPATSGELFTGKHSYFVGILREDRQAVAENTDLMKEFMPYNRVLKAGENSVHVSDFADLNDLQPNIEAAKIVAEFLKKDVYIRPHINAAHNHKNPELGIGCRNIPADLKTMEKESKNFFESRIKSASKQGCKYVVVNIDNYGGRISELHSKIKAGFEYKRKPKNTNVEKIIIIRNKKAIRLTRKQISGDLFGDLEKLQ